MRRFKLSSVLAMVLSVVLLMGSLPMAAFAVTPSVGLGAGTPNYDKFRGNGMTADANGVMVYDDLASYKKTSQKDMALAVNYQTVGPDATNKSSSATTVTYDECTALYVDYAVYYDESIEGNTVKIRHGLSMMDSVEYMDAEGNIVKSDKSPIELSASYKNEAYPDYNAGYGMVYNEDTGELEYTTRYYKEKAILFYIINHTSYERIGQEDDVSILQDYIDQGYVIVTLDFKSHANATSPYIEQALVSAQSTFESCAEGTILGNLGVTTSAQFIYCLPEGCRIERDVWYWDSSIWGVEGTMDAYRNKWNQKISYESTYTVNGVAPEFPDYYQVGNLETVEEMIAMVGQYVNKSGYSDEANGKPIEYKLSMNIIYPSQPKSGYEVPVYVQEGTGYTREDGIGTEYKRGTFNAFALNGYACVQYDHCYWPFLYRWGYQFYNSGADYALATNAPRNAQAAVRCVRSLASALGYSSEYLGAAGISKATFGLSALSLKDNKNYPHGNVSFTDFLTNEKKTYSKTIFEADIRDEAGTVTQTIQQPFMYYDEEHAEEISSDSCVTYISSGQGYERLFGTGSLASYEKVPLLVSGGLRDNYNCYDYWDESVVWFEENLTDAWLPLVQLDQGHAYLVGDDTEFGYNRGNAMLQYFDVFLRPDDERAPEVLWATPLNGATDVAVSGKWTVGPYTPYGQANWALDSYYYPQAIQIRFLDAVDPATVNSGVTVTVTETGAKVDGTWVASQNDALYTFECDGLTAGTRYTIDITSGVKGKNGVALAETRRIGFKTEGTYALSPVADAYVSSNEPDKAFGSANKLQVSNAYTTLVSYDTEHILDATKIQLKANGSVEDTVNLEIFALADYEVDEATLTYNTLVASDAWTNKVSLGTYSLVDGNISLDLYDALSAVEGLGDTVTLAFVSTDTLTSDTPHILTNDFETPTIGTTLYADDGETIIVRDAPLNGHMIIRDESNANTANSIYWWRVTGATQQGHLKDSSTVSMPAGGKQVMATLTSPGSNKVKFYNSLTDAEQLTEADVGKTFRVTVDIYTTQAITVSVGTTTGPSVSGVINAWDFCTNSFSRTVPANTWTSISGVITVTQNDLNKQAGLVAFDLPYTGSSACWTYWDNLVIEECTPMLTVASTEAGSTGGFTLVTTNPGAPLNEPLSVTFDEAMDITTFKKGMVVTNEKTGERIKGTWAAADDTDTVFTFATDGLMANTTYTVATTADVKTAAGVACTEEIVKTVVTEGSYSLNPIATSYVSVANAATHYGLDADPVLDADKLGVVTFSTKTLASAQLAKLYLSVDSVKNGAIRVYALNYTPDDTLCYNSVKDSLTDANLLGLYSVDMGTVSIDVSDLIEKATGDAVTLVMKAGYVYFNDFSTPVVSSESKQLPGTSARHPENEPFSDTYIWAVGGAAQDAWIMPASGTDSQFFRVRNYGGQTNKFYNTLKNDLMNAGDVGRTYNVSFKVRAAIRTPDAYTGDVTTLTVDAGFANRISVTYNGTTYSPHSLRDTQTTRPSVTLTLGDTNWSTVTFSATVSELMVGLQAGLFTCSIPKIVDPADSTKSINVNVDYDDILVEEVVSSPIALDKNLLILMTENTELEDVTDEDNPVADERYPSAINEPIEVTFNTAMDLTTFKKGMIVTNVATGERVAGTWTATDATNMNFAFTTKGFVAGATYTVATTAAVKTLGGTACGNKTVKTVTMEGSYALRPVVTSYVSKSEPAQHFGLDTDLVLDTNKLGVVTFSAKTLENAEDAFLYMPWNATRKTFIYVYALADTLPDNTLCYNSIKASLTEDNLFLMDEWASGTYAIDLTALADKELGDNVTLVIKAGYTFSNDFETPRLGGSISKVVTLSDGTTATVKPVCVATQKDIDGSDLSDMTVVINSAYGYNGVGKNLPFFWWRGTGSTQIAALVNDPSGSNNTQVFRTRLNYGGNGVKFYHVFRPDGAALTADDIGKTYNVSFDYLAPQSITLYMAPLVYDGAVDGFGTSNSIGVAVTKDQWNDIDFQLTLTEANVTAGKNLLGIKTKNVKPEGAEYDTYYQHFDNLKVEEVVDEFTLPADSFILVTENEESVGVTDANNPVKDVIYSETEITAAEVALGTSITVNYYVILDDAHAGAQMKFTVDGDETLVDGVKSGDEYVYSYTGIAPQGLGTNIKAELIVNGQVVAAKDEYSVLQNCKNLLAKTATELRISSAKYEAMKKLIADLLAYGAAAQVYTEYDDEALVNEGIEGASEFVALGDEWSKVPTQSTDENIGLTGAGLYFTNTNRLYFRFEASGITEDNFRVKIGDVEYTLSDFSESTNSYILYSEDLAATDLDTLYTVELIKDDVTIQTLEYGVFAYVYSMQNSDNEAMANLAKATYNYGVSADAYAIAE